MTPPVLRALTWMGWAAGGVGVLVAIAVVLSGLGFRWDPFDRNRRQLEQAEAGTLVAERQAAAFSAEATGQAGQVARLDAALHSAVALERATAQSLQIARTANDAFTPLDNDRADRLRAHDRGLCRVAPDLVGCPAPLDPSDNGEPTL